MRVPTTVSVISTNRLRRSLIAVLLGAVAGGLPAAAAAGTPPSGDRSFGNVSIEPAYDDVTGGYVFLLTPNRLAPLGPDPVRGPNQQAATPLYLVVYPPGTDGTFDCMGVPGNCPDHDGVIAGVATSVLPSTYGSDPTAVPGHDHLVGAAGTGGDFKAHWHVYVELFTSPEVVTHITTLAQLQEAWASGAVMATGSGLGIDTGITFVGALVAESTYLRGQPG